MVTVIHKNKLKKQRLIKLIYKVIICTRNDQPFTYLQSLAHTNHFILNLSRRKAKTQIINRRNFLQKHNTISGDFSHVFGEASMRKIMFIFTLFEMIYFVLNSVSVSFCLAFWGSEKRLHLIQEMKFLCFKLLS